MRRLLRRFRYMLQSTRNARLLRDEMAYHAELLARDLEASGHTAAEARNIAARRMGNDVIMRENARGVWIFPRLEAALQDVRFGLRLLRRERIFSVTAVMTLACGIGLSACLYTAFRSLSNRTLASGHGTRVMNVYATECCEREGGQPNGFSIAEMKYLAAASHTTTGFALHRDDTQDVDGEATVISRVSSNYFELLGVSPRAGRLFDRSDDDTSAPSNVAVIGNDYWRSHFGSDATAIGKTLRINDVQFTVIGIAPPGFSGTTPARTDVWIPLRASRLIEPKDGWVTRVANRESGCCTSMIGRLAREADQERATSELSELRRRFYATSATSQQRRVVLRPLTVRGAESPMRGDPADTAFPLMSVAVAAVLLLACANVANLLLTRATAREREISMRAALGASRGRIVTQLLIESTTLALSAAALGVAASWWLPRKTVQLFAPGLRSDVFRPDVHVLVFASLLALVCTIIFGLAPAIYATRPPRAAAPRMLVRSVLLTAQVALSTCLLCSAALLARGLSRELNRNGFDARNVSIIEVHAPRSTDHSQIQALAKSLSALVSEPGVALTTHIPFVSVGKGTAGADRMEPVDVLTDEVSGGYFHTIGLRILRGRAFSVTDAGQPVAIINQTLAADLELATGSLFEFNGRSTRVIGIVTDYRRAGESRVEPTVFTPITGATMPNILVPSPGTRRIVQYIERIDDRLTVRTTPAISYLQETMRSARMAAIITAGLGGLALFLASIGMFGVFAFWVQQKTREIGVRMAIGARGPDVARMVSRSAVPAISVGVVTGVVLAFGASRVLRAMLYGLNAADPVAYAGVISLIVISATIAMLVPARRALGIDPAATLRAES